MNALDTAEDTAEKIDPKAIESGIQVFRFTEIPSVPTNGEESFWVRNSPVIDQGWKQLVEAGWLDGLEFRVLLDMPGFNLAYGRLKPGLTVPLHYHHGHGWYFVTAGTAFYGNIELKAGDGLFQPAKNPYTLTAGKEGLEIIEIRTVGGANTIFMSNSEKYWKGILEKTVQARKKWTTGWPEHYGEMVTGTLNSQL